MKRTAQPFAIEPLEERRLFSGTVLRPPSPPTPVPVPYPNVDVDVSITHTGGKHIPDVVITAVVGVDVPNPVSVIRPIPPGIIAILIGFHDGPTPE